jgi:hypothetical protein
MDWFAQLPATWFSENLLNLVIALLVLETVLILSAVAYIVHENNKRAQLADREAQSRLFWEQAQ